RPSTTGGVRICRIGRQVVRAASQNMDQSIAGGVAAGRGRSRAGAHRTTIENRRQSVRADWQEGVVAVDLQAMVLHHEADHGALAPVMEATSRSWSGQAGSPAPVDGFLASLSTFTLIWISAVDDTAPYPKNGSNIVHC